MDEDPIWRVLIKKKSSDLSDKERAIIDMNPELWQMRTQYNTFEKTKKELEKRNKNIKKEYEDFVQWGIKWDLWLDEWDVMWSAIDENVWPNTGNLWEDAQKLYWFSDENPSIAVWDRTENLINMSADEQLRWAWIAAAKEWWYTKWLASRTWSSFWETQLADDRARAKYGEQAAWINAQRAANLMENQARLDNLAQQNLDRQTQPQAVNRPSSGWNIDLDEIIKQQNNPSVPSGNTGWYDPRTWKVTLFWWSSPSLESILKAMRENWGDETILSEKELDSRSSKPKVKTVKQQNNPSVPSGNTGWYDPRTWKVTLFWS